MLKNLDFILKSIIIYITLGFAINAATEIALKHIYLGRALVFVGFFLVLNRLVRYDKQKNIKLFKSINIEYFNIAITFVTMFLIEFFHII